MKLQTLLVIGCAAATLSLPACGAPATFVRASSMADPQEQWSTIEVRTTVSYDQAWEAVLDTLVKQFELAILSRPDGYMRTNWFYTWGGTRSEKYRVRVTVKFSADYTRVSLKSEAEYGGEGRWEPGYDTRLLTQLKNDMMGLVGSTAR